MIQLSLCFNSTLRPSAGSVKFRGKFITYTYHVMESSTRKGLTTHTYHEIPDFLQTLKSKNVKLIDLTAINFVD